MVTNLVSHIKTNSARLHSVHINRNGNVLTSFEYGKTRALGLTTNPRVINSATNTQSISGLSANTKYYYRAVMIDENKSYTGLIRTFTTNRIHISPPIIPEKETINLIINKTVSQEKTSGFGLEIEAIPGDVVYYKVRIRNDSRKDLKNIRVTDNIPILSKQNTFF